MSNPESLRQNCWKRALEAHGTAYIFEQRAAQLESRLTWITYLGIAVPAIVGTAATSSWVTGTLFNVLSIVAFIVLLGQLGFSIWAVVARWQEKYSYALESVAANHRLSGAFRDLASNPPDDFQVFQQQFALIAKEDELRNVDDLKQKITEREKRMGMRAGLRQFGKACASCKEIPTSMEATDCEVCGNF